MHIYQALKMACKSLWTNKLRSFLTMLGIIIGVLTVSLLTTVAQGVSNAVISSIRSQSTLSIFMNMSPEITYGKANGLIGSVQSEYDENDESYFKYSLIMSSSSIVGLDDITDLSSGAVDESNFAFDQAYVIDDESYNNLSNDQKSIADVLKTIKARSSAMKTTIYAVDKNFDEVYDFKIKGNFPKDKYQILVDENFVKSYFGNIELENAVDRYVTFGISANTEINLTFADTQDSSILSVLEMIASNKLTKVKDSTLSRDGKTVTLYVKYFRVFNEESIKNYFNAGLTSASVSSQIENVSFNNTYDMTNAKAFLISGVLSNKDNNSLFSSGSSSMEGSDELNAMTLAFAGSSDVKGTCYMLIDEETKVIAGVPSGSNLNDQMIRYAYLRFKTENVMDSVNNKITLAFIGGNFQIMKDFIIISMSSVAKIISNVMNIMTTMLAVISAISLVVGGIGIMNIMLVAVTERTREIGIRKAIGAKRSSILVQFLVEALMLSLFGGALGLGLSAIGVVIISHVMGITMAMPLWVVLMSVGFCTAIGLIFGMYPAIKASYMQPIDALRRE